MANNLQFGKVGVILLSSAIFILASFRTCQGRPYESAEDDNRNDVPEIAKGFPYNPKSLEEEPRDGMESENEMWNNIPIMPHPRLSYHDTGNFWPASPAQLARQSVFSLPPNGMIVPPPPRKRFSLPEDSQTLNSNSIGGHDGHSLNQQQQVLSDYLSNSRLTPSGLGGIGGRQASGFPDSVGIGPGFRYRPAAYNFRSSPNGRLSGYMAPVTPRKRQILFRQCFFNPISCF